MLFNSIDFAVFFPIVLTLYWIFASNLNLRNIFLLVASYFFYGWWDWRFLFLIFISSLVDYFVGRKLGEEENPKKRKHLLFLSLAVNLGFLFYFKYFNFFIETFRDSFLLFGKELEISTLNIILPVGISFYTFQTLSYTIDVYKGKLTPTHKPISFFAFVSFFPQLVAGPIERATHLLPQFNKTYKFDYVKVRAGFQLMLWGLFKKMVIADRLALVVNEVYNNPGSYQGSDFIIATIFFAFQIYCDFSGYSDIAIGLAKTMGFDLMKNFDSPYFSKSLTEFWRRWHISLSTWFRDYLYIPLGGSKKGKYRTYLNLFLVFLISGLWHGASMTFVIWGAIHGIIITFEKATSSIRKKFSSIVGLKKNVFSNRIVFGIITFIIVMIAWVFFRANTLSDSWFILKNMIALKSGSGFDDLGVSSFHVYISIVMIVILMVIEFVDKHHDTRAFLNRQNALFRWSVYLIGIFSILLYGVYGQDSPEFIYFKF